MISPFKISLQVPNYDKTDRYFSFRLQDHYSNEPAEFRSASKTFVVSDIEGNFAPFFKLLVTAQVISPTMDWIFDDGHLVILGDCFDRGEEVTECLWLIYALEEKAKRVGGHVHFILGNHEIMNMNGDWRYIHPRYAMNTVSEKHRPTAFYYGNKELWNWLKTKNIIEKIGPVLFVHGGISPETLALKLDVSELNEMARPWYGHANEAIFKNEALAVLFDGEVSPFWYRGYYTGAATSKLIKETLNFYGVSAIVTGHTILEKVTGFFDNRVINVNTDHANGISEGLMIIKKRFFRIEQTGNVEKFK